MDAYVLRLNPHTGKLVYAARIFGSEYDNAARIQVDPKGFAYAAGFTKSRDFPATPDAIQPKYGGGDSDAFLVKVTPQGKVAYATFLGGSGADQGNGLELDPRGAVYVAGTTWSQDFPGQSTSRAAAGGDVFVSWFRPEQRGAVRSAVFGGEQEEKLTGIALDGRGGLAVVGYTKSAGFPTTRPLQPALKGPSDLFLTLLALPDLTPTFSTFLGGSGDDSGWGVAIGPGGELVVAGITDSPDLATHPSAFQRSNQGGQDAFLAKFQGQEFRAFELTYFGGSNDDGSGYDGADIKIDEEGAVWLAGITASLDLPTRNAFQAKYGGGEIDGFLAAFSSDLSTLCYGTYLGGADRDLLEGLAVWKGNGIFATGVTFSGDLPTTSTHVQPRQSPITVAGRTVNNMLLGLKSHAACR